MCSGVGIEASIWQKQGVRIFLLLSIITIGSLQAAPGRYGNGSSAQQQREEGPINKPLAAIALKGSPKAIFQRVIQARLFQSGTWTLGDTSQTTTTAARTLSSLQPTFLPGVLRLPDHGELSDAEIEAFSAVRTTVLSSSKNCRFDVLINAGEEQSSEIFLQRMKEFNVRLHPDSWTFYVSPETRVVSPNVFEDGIAEAHAAGQMVGYDGPLSLIPEGVDFIVVRAWNFKVNRDQIDSLRAKQKIPILVELPTTFGTKCSREVVSYVEEMNSQERVASITELAENQYSWGYRFAYPIFYPLYPARHAFDATTDNILFVSIRAFLSRFN